MTESEINKLAYGLINLLEVTPKNQKTVSRKFENFVGINVEDFKNSTIKPVSHLIDSLGNLCAVKKGIQDYEVGISKENYRELQLLANEIISIPYFNNFTDYRFIEIEIFQWLINIYETNISSSDLINYLKNKVEEELYNYEFYYKVSSLGIEKEFIIGNILFTSLSTTFFENEFSKMGQKYDQNKKNLESYTKKVIAIAQVYATKDRAKNKSIYNVKLALNVLKIFMLNESIMQVELPYMDDDRNDEFLSFIGRDKHTNFLTFNFKSGSQTSIITTELLETFKSKGLDVVSEFINSKKNDELYFEIINKIDLLGESHATHNFYERSIKLISLLESFLIPEGNIKGLGQTYVNQIAKKCNDNELTKAINEIYEVRNKFLHNRIELKINPMSFYKFQGFALTFILELIKLNGEYKNRQAVLDFFGIRNKLKNKK